MAVTWKEISRSDRFQNLMDGDREKVRTAFYKEKVEPQLTDDNREYGTSKFYDMTMDDVLPPEARTVEDNIPEILGSKGVGAFLVGMGAGMRDTYDGAKQIFNVGEEQLEKDKGYFKELEDSEFGGTVLAGQITGFIAEPLGFIIPAAKGKSLFNVAKVGAAVGAGFGAVGYVDTHRDQSRMGNVLMGAALGGTLSPAFVGVGRALSKTTQKAEVKMAGMVLDNLNDKVHQFQAAGASPSLAIRAAKRFYSLTDTDVTSAMMKVERKLSLAKSQKDASRIMEGKLASNFDPAKTTEEVKASSLLSKIPVVGEGLAKGKEKTGKAFENILTPVASRISRISPKLGGSLRKMEFESHLKVAKSFEKVNPFSDSYKGLPSEVRDSLKRPLLSGDFKQVKEILKAQKNGDVILKQFDDVNKTLSGLYGELRKTGYKIPKLDNYWPRVVNDPDGVTKVEHSIIQREYDKLAKRKGRKITQDEKAGVVKHMFTPGMQERVWGQTSASLRKRKFNELDDKITQYYADPIDALNHYVHQNIQDVSRRNFMKKHGFNKEPKLDGSDLEESIQDIIVKMRDKGEIDINQEGEIIDILKARFGPGVQAPSQAVQFFKNSTYAVTLGNPLSAMTQFGDLAFSGYKYGAYNAITSMFGRKLVKKEALGLMDAIEEIAGDANRMKKVADWTFKWGGFNKVDRLGKETFVNASLKHYNSMVKKNPEQFVKQWSGVFGEETGQLLNDVAAKKTTDNVKLMLWNELSDVQPISLSEMPLKYLQSPNGRVLYTLRTFTVKQLDFMRKQIVDEYKSGNRMGAMKNMAKFTTLFVAANSTVDAAKDFVKGKDIDIEDHIVDNVWTLAGLNKYTFKEAKSKGLGSAAIQFVAPPLNVYDDITRGFDDPKRWFNLMPPYGKLIHNWSKSESDKYYEFTDIGKGY